MCDEQGNCKLRDLILYAHEHHGDEWVPWQVALVDFGEPTEELLEWARKRAIELGLEAQAKENKWRPPTSS